MPPHDRSSVRAPQRHALRITRLLHLPTVSIYEIEQNGIVAYALCDDASATILDDERVDRLIVILSQHDERESRRHAVQVRSIRTLLAHRRGDA